MKPTNLKFAPGTLTLAGSCSFVKQLRAISAQNKNEEERSGVTRFRSLDRLTAMTGSFYLLAVALRVRPNLDILRGHQSSTNITVVTASSGGWSYLPTPRPESGSGAPTHLPTPRSLCRPELVTSIEKEPNAATSESVSTRRGRTDHSLSVLLLCRPRSGKLRKSSRKSLASCPIKSHCSSAKCAAIPALVGESVCFARSGSAIDARAQLPPLI